MEPVKPVDSWVSGFGLTVEPAPEEKARLLGLVTDSPLAVFQALNKALNEKGLCISVDALHTR